MEAKRIATLIALLEAIQRRPGMYIFGNEPEAAADFLSGFQVAVEVGFGFECDNDRSLRKKVTESRGWQWSNTIHPYRQMMVRGMSAQEIVAELAAIEVGVLNSALERGPCIEEETA